MMEGGKESMALAISLGLPASNAVEIGDYSHPLKGAGFYGFYSDRL